MIHNGIEINTVLFNNYNIVNWIHNGKEVFSQYGSLPDLPKDSDGNQYKFYFPNKASVLYDNNIYVFNCSNNFPYSYCVMKYNGFKWDEVPGILPLYDEPCHAIVYNDLIYIMYEATNEMYVYNPKISNMGASKIGAAHIGFRDTEYGWGNDSRYCNYFVLHNKLFCLYRNITVSNINYNGTCVWDEAQQEWISCGGIIPSIDDNIGKYGYVIEDEIHMFASEKHYIISYKESTNSFLYIENIKCEKLAPQSFLYDDKIYIYEYSASRGFYCLKKNDLNIWELFWSNPNVTVDAISFYESLQMKNSIIFIGSDGDNMSNIASYKTKEPSSDYKYKWNNDKQCFEEI